MNIQPTDQTTELLANEKSRIGTWGAINKQRLSIIHRRAGPSVLDVGCAGGAYVKRLRAKEYQAYGLDLLRDAAWEGFPNWFIVSDVYSLPYQSEEVDTVVAFEVLEHLVSPLKALIEMKRVASRNVILSVPNASADEAFQSAGLTYHHWVDRTHVQAFTRKDLLRLMRVAQLSVQEFRYINPVFPEIVLLTGWGVPLAIARRLGRLMGRIRPHQYCMTLLVAAGK